MCFVMHRESNDRICVLFWVLTGGGLRMISQSMAGVVFRPGDERCLDPEDMGEKPGLTSHRHYRNC